MYAIFSERTSVFFPVTCYLSVSENKVLAGYSSVPFHYQLYLVDQYGGDQSISIGVSQSNPVSSSNSQYLSVLDIGKLSNVDATLVETILTAQ